VIDGIDSPLGPDFTAAEARAITDKISAYQAVAWRSLWIARKRNAHKALGKTWKSYLADEFGKSESYGVRLLAHADLIHAIEEAAGIPEAERENMPIGKFTEGATRGLDAETVAADVAEATADLAPDDTEGRADAAAAVVAEHIEAAKTSPSAVEPDPAPAPADGDTIAPSVEPDVVAGAPEGEAGSEEGEPSDPAQVPPPPDPAPAPSPLAGAGSPPKVKPVDLAPPHLVYRERASKAVVKAGDLLRLDPAEIVRCMDPDERSSYVSLAADLGRFGRELAAALDKPNIRRVK